MIYPINQSNFSAPDPAVASSLCLGDDLRGMYLQRTYIIGSIPKKHNHDIHIDGRKKKSDLSPTLPADRTCGGCMLHFSWFHNVRVKDCLGMVIAKQLPVMLTAGKAMSFLPPIWIDSLYHL